MTDKKVVTQSNNVNPVVAAVAGAVVAGAAVAGAYALSNKDNQDKVSKVVADVKDNLQNKKEIIVDKAKKLEDIAKNTVNDVKNL